ncbi:hypothetical protein [Ekhidna sp.]
MKFISGQSKKDFLSDLKRVTHSGSPSLASLPSLLPSRFENRFPFYGIISKDSFHLSIKDGVSNPGKAMNGSIVETDSGIVINVQFQFLFIPILFIAIVVVGFFVGGTFLFIQTMRPEPLICHIVATAVLLYLQQALKKEKRTLITRFLANTSANKC